MSNDTNNNWALKQIDIFEGLDEVEAEKIIKVSNQRLYVRKEVIYSPDDVSDRLYYIKKGKVKLSKFSPDGREIILGICKDSDVFGEMMIYNPMHRESFAIALEESTIWMIRKGNLEKIIRQIPLLKERLMIIIAQRRNEVEQRLEDIVFKTVSGRLSGLILALGRKFGEDVKGGKKINLKLIHYDIANLIGSTRETTTAVLNEFKRKGLIAIQEKMIIILNKKGLEEINSPT